MSKIKTKSKSVETNPKFDQSIMAEINSGKLKMRSKWYFVFGSLLSIFSLVGLSLVSIFSTNLILFLLRRHGSMAQWRLNLILQSLPIWIPILTVITLILGIWLLKKYDFSYKKNFLLIIFIFIFSIILSAFLLDHFGLNQIWSQQGKMRQFYQNLESGNKIYFEGQGRMKGGQGRNLNRQNQ